MTAASGVTLLMDQRAEADYSKSIGDVLRSVNSFIILMHYQFLNFKIIRVKVLLFAEGI